MISGCALRAAGGLAFQARFSQQQKPSEKLSLTEERGALQFFYDRSLNVL
jgi:hypothetical protein